MVNLSQEDSERYHELFKKLDHNSDGKIDVNDLVVLFDKNKLNSNESSISRAKVYFILSHLLIKLKHHINR